jgi:hypothetical protein
MCVQTYSLSPYLLCGGILFAARLCIQSKHFNIIFSAVRIGYFEYGRTAPRRGRTCRQLRAGFYTLLLYY